jgi:ABC-type phosphate/phosphonate transport system substrate-binding protein
MMPRTFLTAGCLLLIAAAPLAAKDPDIIQIGIVDSLVKDLTPGKRKLLDSEFPSLMLEFTGLKSEVLQGGDPLTAGKNFADGKWHLGIFQGVDFAWAQSKDAKLQPLMIAIGPRREIHAVLVVKKDSTAAGFADLKGKAVQLLQGREHCRLFAEKGAKAPLQQFFSKVTKTNSGEGALDEVLIGTAQAAIVDTAALESYKEIQPGRYKRLKVLAESEQFPASVIAYREGVLSKDLLDKFKTGMLKANDSDRGRDLMADFRITSFEEVPADYAKRLSSIAKAYPPPSK